MFQAAIRQHLPCDKQPANLAILCPRKHRWFYPKYATKDTIQIDPSADHSVIGLSISTAVGTVFWHATLSQQPSVVVFSLVEFHHNSIEIQRTWILDRWLGLSHAQPPARHIFFRLRMGGRTQFCRWNDSPDLTKGHVVPSSTWCVCIRKMELRQDTLW